MNLKKILFSIIIICASTKISFGQSSAVLKKEREKIEAEIAALNKELAAKTREKNAFSEGDKCFKSSVKSS